MAGKGGGAWKVAYADFVTAMMAFFLVMWITGQSKQVKQAIAHYFNAPFKSAAKSGESFTGEEATLAPSEKPITLIPPSPGLPAGGRGVVDRGPGVPVGDGLTRGRPSGPVMVTLHDADRQIKGAAIQFTEHSAELSQAAADAIRRLVPEIRGKRNKIELRGHTTRRPLPAQSPYKDAWQLSYARCVATKKLLEQEGIEAERIRMSQAGEFEPQTIREEPAQQAMNSRVEIYVLPEVVEDLVGTKEERERRAWKP
jgi:chemotaxis protein MotB